MINILNRWTDAVIRHSETAQTIAEAVTEAMGNAADLRAADLRAADLRAADLSAANLRAADLRDANLSAADLRAADLRAADLRDANLSAADLRAADLSAADLSAADLSAADLSAANLRAADLSAADLSAKQYVCRIQGRRHEINAINDDIRIGCIRMPLAEWLLRYEEIGREQRYTAFEIAEYGEHLRHLQSVLALWMQAEENVEKSTALVSQEK